MNSMQPLSPLIRDPPLNIVISGRNKSGKTTLFNYFKSQAHHFNYVDTLQKTNHPTIPRSRFLFPWLSQTIPITLCRNTYQFVSSTFVKIFLKRKSVSAVELLSPSNSKIILWDAPQEDGMSTITKNIPPNEIDVILYVTRLDHSRIERFDKYGLMMLKQNFGEHILHKLLIVFTRGSSLPPLNLTFEEFVRGRIDIITSFITQVWPPQLKEYSMSQQEQQHSEQGENTDSITHDESQQRTDDISTNQVNPEKIKKRKRRAKEAALREARATYMRVRDLQQEDSVDYATEAILGLTPNSEEEDISDAESYSKAPDNFIDSIYEDQVSSTDERVVEMPFKPMAVVTELSDQCPIDEITDEAVLPNGEPWFPQIIQTIAKVADQSRRKKEEILTRQQQEEGRQLLFPVGDTMEIAVVEPRLEQDSVVARRRRRTGRPIQFLKKLREMIQSLSQDGLRIMLAELLLMAVFVQTLGTLEKARQRRKEKQAAEGDPDLLLSLTDDEYKDRMTIIKEPLILYERKESKREKNMKNKGSKEEESEIEAELYKAIDEIQEEQEKERDRMENPEKYEDENDRVKGRYEIDTPDDRNDNQENNVNKL